MPNEATAINPKVTASAIGGAVGGGTITIAIIQILQRGFNVSAEWFTPEMVIVLTSVVGGIVGFASGWLKKYIP